MMMADKLSRKINVERFDNLSLNKAMETEDILELDSAEIHDIMIHRTNNIIEQSQKHLMAIDREFSESSKKQFEHIKDNKFMNEYVIKETINKLYDQSLESGDPAFFLLLKQFIELSIKNDESLMKILEKMNGGVKQKESNISGNESVNIQNNYYGDNDLKKETSIGSPMQLLQEYGEANGPDSGIDTGDDNYVEEN